MSDAELDLKRFDVISRYLAYEGTIYWSRSSFFLGVNAGLFGLLVTLLKDRLGDFDFICGATSALGFLLSFLWLTALRAGDYWTGRWEALCRVYEPAAFGEIEVFRNCRPKGVRSAKQTAHWTAAIFISTWTVSLGYQIALFFYWVKTAG